ncbi:hypothetical protein P4O66_006181 [Electrophorus voltai]|uniref:EF-hand domain-containing protein n=1 Tax=Electrophorus voltai TaxID=2609070 RepID=A0AAD9E0E2_9TELE|nr:hypothetical protein P4O66_006181 [Electrophorus voltai]
MRAQSMETSEACDPYSRPARRTQWIVSTLAYHYGLDRGVENEIIVLATGLDQYLQEIFHHLDCQGEGRIPAEDFIILCDILGLSKESEVEECAGMLDSLPSELTFRQFHAKLCGYFSTKAGRPYENGRLLVGRDSEHIETQIRLRSPLRRREKLLTLGAGRRIRGCAPAADRLGSGCKQGACTRECYEEIVALEEAEDRIGKLEEENASLRELVEDMRAALQSSDARSLALQVGLWKSHSKHRPDSGCFTARHAQAVQRSGAPDGTRSLRGLLRELELAQNARAGQVEAVVLLNRKLEQELHASRETVLVLEECNRTLRTEQVGMRRKAEEAREALRSGLAKVKELEAKARRVPALQKHLQQIEMELLYYRSALWPDMGEQARATRGSAMFEPLSCTTDIYCVSAPLYPVSPDTFKDRQEAEPKTGLDLKFSLRSTAVQACGLAPSARSLPAVTGSRGGEEGDPRARGRNAGSGTNLLTSFPWKTRDPAICVLKGRRRPRVPETRGRPDLRGRRGPEAGDTKGGSAPSGERRKTVSSLFTSSVTPQRRRRKRTQKTKTFHLSVITTPVVGGRHGACTHRVKPRPFVISVPLLSRVAVAVTVAGRADGPRHGQIKRSGLWPRGLKFWVPGGRRLLNMPSRTVTVLPVMTCPTEGGTTALPCVMSLVGELEVDKLARPHWDMQRLNTDYKTFYARFAVHTKQENRVTPAVSPAEPGHASLCHFSAAPLCVLFGISLSRYEREVRSTHGMKPERMNNGRTEGSRAPEVFREDSHCSRDGRDTQQDRGSPTGRAEIAHDNMEEQLLRSVEGQAASDEEGDQWSREQQQQVDEVKRILTRLSCCSRAEEGYIAVLELLDRVTRLHKQLELRESQTRRAEPQLHPEPEQINDSLVQELQHKAEETELLQRELQMLETERVRLSLVEDKLMDILQLLQQLRDLNVSRRSLGKILMSTLETCSDPQHGKAHILEVLNALCHELAACEILSSSATPERAQSHQSVSSSLFISC